MKPGRSGSVIAESDTELNYIVIDIDVGSDDGILSVIAMTDFSDLNVFLELTNHEHRIIAIEKSAMLDAVKTNNDPGLNNDESSATAAQGVRDMIHSIELPEMKKGKYKLRIGLPKAYWMKQQKMDTCLSFDFIMEYVVKKTSSYSDEEEGQDIK